MTNHFNHLVDQTGVNSIVRRNDCEEREGEPCRVGRVAQVANDDQIREEVKTRGDFNKE